MGRCWDICLHSQFVYDYSANGIWYMCCVHAHILLYMYVPYHSRIMNRQTNWINHYYFSHNYKEAHIIALIYQWEWISQLIAKYLFPLKEEMFFFAFEIKLLPTLSQYWTKGVNCFVKLIRTSTCAKLHFWEMGTIGSL